MNSLKKSMKGSAILLSVLVLLEDKNLLVRFKNFFLCSVEQKVPWTISEQFRRWNETMKLESFVLNLISLIFLGPIIHQILITHVFIQNKENIWFTIDSQSTGYLIKGRLLEKKTKKKQKTTKEKHQVSKQSLIVY